MTNRMPELLCPAGNLESLEAALHFGADAVYGGMRQFGLRAFAGNFDEEALKQAVEKMCLSFCTAAPSSATRRA